MFGERALLDLHRGALDDAAIRRHGVARLEDDDVAHDDIGGGYLDLAAVADDLGLGGAHLLQAREGVLCLVLLHHAEHGVEHDHEDDDEDVGEVSLALHHAGHGGDDRRDDEHDDHRVGHHGEEPLPQRILLRILQLVGTVLLETRRCLRGGEAELGIGS